MKAILIVSVLFASASASAAEPPPSAINQPPVVPQAETTPPRSDPDLYAAVMQMNIMIGRLYVLQGEETDLLRRIEENTASLKGAGGKK